MKIAIFTETYFPSINGVATHIKALRDGLEKLGHQVLIITADKNCKAHYIHEGVLYCPAIEVKRFYGFGAAPPYSRKRLKMIERFAPDIIHVHHEFGVGISGIYSAKRFGLPLVYTLHTMYDEYIYYISTPKLHWIVKKISHKYVRFIASRADALTGPSKKCDEYFRQIGIKKEMNLIPNSVNLSAFHINQITEEKKKEMRSAYGINDGSMLACFAGRLGKEKSVDILLKYWAKEISAEDRLHLLIIGDGPERKSLEELAEELGISKMVTFAGLVKHQEMPVYIGMCDIYVTASTSDTNSISMLEAMAAGLPVLQRYDELNEEQIAEDINGYIWQNAAELGARLKEMRDLSKEERKELKKKVRETVRSHGTIQLATHMLNIYGQVQAEK
jgi:1,2-diacylglycerol 3-alpha-glucosyltransferase